MSQTLNVIQDNSPWYAAGLRFKCTECGQCCTGSPGYAWVTELEIIEIANYLKMTIDDFSRKYIRRIEDRFALLEHPINYDCVFLKDKKCQIYPVRPTQCKTFPWWQQNLKTEADWQAAAEFCEGINSSAPLVPFNEIQAELSNTH